MLLLMLACTRPDPTAAIERLATAREAPVANPDLSGSWVVHLEESGFASTVKRRQLRPGVYDVDVTVELHRDGAPWIAMEGRAIEAFGTTKLCMTWTSARAQALTTTIDDATRKVLASMTPEGLDAAPCQTVTERTATTLRLNNGTDYVERRP